jgi:hypothetical protein
MDFHMMGLSNLSNELFGFTAAQGGCHGLIVETENNISKL